MWTELKADEVELLRLVRRSLPEGMLTLADTGVLERYAIAWARFRQCQRVLWKEGLMTEGRYGPTRHPMLITQREAATDMHAAGEVLGLSPVARTRIAADGTGHEDPLELLLDGRKDGAYVTSKKARSGD